MTRWNHWRRNDPMERYTHAARWLPASFDTFVNLTAVLDAGMKMNQGSIADLENTYVVPRNCPSMCSHCSSDTDDRDYFQRVYEAFSKSVPGLAEVVLSLHQNPGARKKFIAKVRIYALRINFKTDHDFTQGCYSSRRCSCRRYSQLKKCWSRLHMQGPWLASLTANNKRSRKIGQGIQSPNDSKTTLPNALPNGLRSWSEVSLLYYVLVQMSHYLSDRWRIG